MSATYEQAQDEMLELLRGSLPADFPVHYQNVNTEFVVPTDDTEWARVMIRTATARTASLGNHNGRRRYEREGTLWIQLFTPAGIGLSRVYALAKILTDAFQAVRPRRCVAFRNVRMNEIGASGNFYQINVLADFSYDEVA